MKVGYARVSSTGQNLEVQIDILKKHGCNRIFQEKKSGTSKNNRDQLNLALDFVRDNDTFVVTRLDRCSRSVTDLYEIVEILNNKNVKFEATQQDLNTNTSSGKLMIGLLSIISEFETDLRSERQKEGIQNALKKGVKFGREPIILSDDEIKQAIHLKESGKTSQDVAKIFNISRSTLLKKIREYRTYEKSNS